MSKSKKVAKKAAKKGAKKAAKKVAKKASPVAVEPREAKPRTAEAQVDRETLPTPRQILASASENLTEATRDKKRIDIVNEVLAAGEEILQGSPDEDGTLTIERFLTEVGEGVLDAQVRLDALSRGYLAERSAVVHPTSFRIPRVQASLRFEFKQSSMSEIKFRKGAANSRSFEHEISFEVIAVPPPVELKGEISSRPWIVVEDDSDARYVVVKKLCELQGGSFSEPNHEKWDREFIIFQCQRDGPEPGDESELRFLHYKSGWQSPSHQQPKLLHGFVDRLGSPAEELPVPRQLVRFFKILRPHEYEWQMVAGILEEIKHAGSDKLKVLLAQLDTAVPGAGSTISTYLESVARSVVDAQRELDQQSAAYLKKGPLVPTAFRIPSLHAELALEFMASRSQQVKSRRLRARPRQSQASSGEQRIAFDIVATPVEPSELQQRVASKLKEGRIVYTLVEATGDREPLRTRLLEATKGTQFETLHTIAEAPERFARAAILRHAQGYVLLVRSGDGQIHSAYFDDEKPGTVDLPAHEFVNIPIQLLFRWLP